MPLGEQGRRIVAQRAFAPPDDRLPQPPQRLGRRLAAGGLSLDELPEPLDREQLAVRAARLRECSDMDELLSALADLDGTRRQFGERYASFRERSCYLDDGFAARRVVDRNFG